VDQKPVTEDNFQGIYVSKITFLRPLSELAANGKNIIFLVLIVILATLLISEVMNIIKQVSHAKKEELIEQSAAEIEALKAAEKERIYQEILEEERQKKMPKDE
jgi:cell division protein FtsN